MATGVTLLSSMSFSASAVGLYRNLIPLEETIKTELNMIRSPKLTMDVDWDILVDGNSGTVVGSGIDI